MTWKDFVCLPWRFNGHLACSDEHYLTRIAESGGHTFGACEHTPTDEWKMEHPYARHYEHYRVDGVVYKSKKKLEEAIKEITL